MSAIRPSNLPTTETGLVGFVHTDRGGGGSAKFDLAGMPVALAASALNPASVGAGTPGTGAFTTLSASTGINSTNIGAGTPGTGAFTTLSASTGINSTNIGASTPGTGAFTTLSSTRPATLGETSTLAQLEANSGAAVRTHLPVTANSITGGYAQGLNALVTLAPTGASSTGAIAVSAFTYEQAAHNLTGGMYGLSAYTEPDGVGSLNDASGVDAYVESWAGSRAITNAFGVSAVVAINSPAETTITNAYGVRAIINNAGAVGAVITNAYALHVPAMTRTQTITNSWGVYVADTTALNYFGGPVGAGIAASATAALVTAAGTTARASLRVPHGVAPTTPVNGDVWTTTSGVFAEVNGATVAVTGAINPGSVGATTPGTGAFTTLAASGAVSGIGFSDYLASPPAIGGTAPAAGSFTTLGSTGALTTNGGLQTFSANDAAGAGFRYVLVPNSV